jgi:hypothetical protein
MTTLAADVQRVKVLGDINEIPVIASDIIYEGAAVGVVDGTGHAQPLTAADRFVGFAESQCDNSTGAAAAKNVRVIKKGAVVLPVPGAVITDVGQPIYATDDNAFAFTPAGGVFIGFVRRWVATNIVEVDFDVDNFVDPWAGRVREALAAATKTLDAQDTGKVICCTVTTVVTLPATATALDNVTLLCVAPFGTAQISADPNANDKIMGPDLAGVDNKDLINTLATARRGDFVTLRAGHTDGYTVTHMKGTWAAEG